MQQKKHLDSKKNWHQQKKNVPLILFHSKNVEQIVFNDIIFSSWAESLSAYILLIVEFRYENTMYTEASGQNPDNSLNLLFTDTSTALPWDFYFLKLTQPLTVSTFQLLYTVKEKGQKTIPPSLSLKKSIQKHQVWELSRLCPHCKGNLHYVFLFWE